MGLLNIFESKKEKIQKEDKKRLGEVAGNLEQHTLSISNSVYAVGKAGKISHGTQLDPKYLKQCEFIKKLMGYGHDSISAHSNIQFLVKIEDPEGDLTNNFIYTLGATKFMNIVVLDNTDEDGTILNKIMVIGSTIRGLRYYLKNIDEYTPTVFKYFTEVIKEVIYTTTDRCFYPDLIKDGILDESEFSYYPLFKEYDDEEEVDIGVEELEQILPEEIKSGKITFIDYTQNISEIIDNINSFFTLDKTEDIYKAILRTTGVTFRIDKMSRAISQQINRHHFGITQESQRYVDYSNATFIDPLESNQDRYDLDKEYEVELFGQTFKSTSSNLGTELIKMYNNLVKQGMLKQDARGFLPFNTETSAYYTSTLEDLIHFIIVRENISSQPEVRVLAREVHDCLNEVLKSAPIGLLEYVNKIIEETEVV